MPCETCSVQLTALFNAYEEVVVVINRGSR